MSIAVNDVYLTAQIDGRTVRVAKFSEACTKKIEELKEKGYTPTDVEVRFVVAWKDDADDVETPIVLANVFFNKN